LLLDL
jgi:hypothetical protein